MIDKETLIAAAKINNLKPWQQEKHYIQSLVLCSLSEEPVVFKGGTCLWFFYGLPRFSEDLDFTEDGKVSDNLPEKVSRDIELFGVENNFKIITNDEKTLSFRISAKGPLNSSDFDLCPVYVEISRREKIKNKKIPFRLDIPAYQIPIKIISSMDLKEISGEKVRAILTRDKARDVYDLYYLIKKIQVKFDESLVNEKLKFCRMKYSENEFLKAVKKKKEYFDKELKPIIFDEMPKFNDCYNLIKKWIQ